MIVTRDPTAWVRLGKQIRQSREEQGYSRKALAEKAGVSEKSIQVAEEGRVPRGRMPQSIPRIEEALGWVPGSYLNILEGKTWAMVETRDFRARLVREPVEEGESLPDGENASTPELEGAPVQMHPTSHAQSAMLASLPSEVRQSLVTVLQFSMDCAENGASLEAVDLYDTAVDLLIKSMLSYKIRSPRFPVGQVAATSPLRPWRAVMQYKPMQRAMQSDVQRRFGEMASRVESVSGFDESIKSELREIAERLEQITAQQQVRDSDGGGKG